MPNPLQPKSGECTFCEAVESSKRPMSWFDKERTCCNECMDACLRLSSMSEHGFDVALGMIVSMRNVAQAKEQGSEVIVSAKARLDRVVGTARGLHTVIASMGREIVEVIEEGLDKLPEGVVKRGTNNRSALQKGPHKKRGKA